MPCSKCGKGGHNVRTCQTKKRRRLGEPVMLEQNDEVVRMKKKLKMLQKRSRKRLRECRELESALATLYDDNEEQEAKLKEQEKQIEDKDDTIQKLRKGESEVCNICFEPVAPGAENKTPCGHTFHCGCLLKWLKTKNTCPCCRAELYEKPNLFTDDFDRVLGDALVDLYSPSIVNDPEMEPLIEFGNYIIEGVIPEIDQEIPTLVSVTDYINDAYTDAEAAAADSSNDEEEDNVWVQLVGSEHDTGIFFVNQNTGDIISNESSLPTGAVITRPFNYNTEELLSNTTSPTLQSGPIRV